MTKSLRKGNAFHPYNLTDEVILRGEIGVLRVIIIFSLKFKRINEQSFDLSLNVIRIAMAVLLACVVGGDWKNILRLSS